RRERAPTRKGRACGALPENALNRVQPRGRGATPACRHRRKRTKMKIVSFESPAGLRLGVVEGDQVIDLQAADPKLPTDLGALLASTNGDLSGIKGLAGRAPASARRPLKGLT